MLYLQKMNTDLPVTNQDFVMVSTTGRIYALEESPVVDDFHVCKNCHVTNAIGEYGHDLSHPFLTTGVDWNNLVRYIEESQTKGPPDFLIKKAREIQTTKKLNWVTIDPNGDIVVWEDKPYFKRYSCGRCEWMAADSVRTEGNECEGSFFDYLGTVHSWYPGVVASQMLLWTLEDFRNLIGGALIYE